MKKQELRNGMELILEDAKKKLQAEINAGQNNTYIQCVGQFLLQYIDNNLEAAEKILAKDKTLAKSLEEMKSEARKKATNGFAVLTDAEGLAIVLKYFGITGSVPSTKIEAQSQKKKAELDIDLEDLL